MNKADLDKRGIQEKLHALPNHPGVYLMKDHRGGVIYVGKAHSLRDRVKSYFQKGASLSARIGSMVQHVTDIEWMVTESDLEALILENNLIKKHKPRYNVILRDDKNYPFLRLYMEDKFPRIEVVRRIRQDGALYFGPYVPVNAMRETLRVIKRVFPLATCKIDLTKGYERPCIEYEIGQCAGPCVGAISEGDYKKVLRDVRLFLEGRDRELLRSMKKRMHEEAERLNFEEAARIRDRISGIEKVLERQRIVSAEAKDMDVMGLVREGGSVDLQVLFFRGGMLVGRKDIFNETLISSRCTKGHKNVIPAQAGIQNAGRDLDSHFRGNDGQLGGFSDEKARDITDEEILGSFIEQFYSRDVIIPSEIILQKEIPDAELVEKWLFGRKNGKVTLTVPKRGKKLGMLKLAIENAQEALKGHGRRRDEKDKGVDELQQILSLSVIPERIEAFDISNIFGAEAVGSLVVWEQGNFKKDEYRRYRIRTVVGADDFAMMQEVVQRRYSGLIAEGSEAPDLIVIDGGKGQLNAVLEVLEGLGIKDIGILGLAKAKGEKGERIFLPGRSEAMELDMKSPATHLLQRIRDEAHRFAISYHRKLRGKEAMISGLDAIKGIGRARKLALLKYFGSIEALKAASIEDLLKAPRMTAKVAEELYKELLTVS